MIDIILTWLYENSSSYQKTLTTIKELSQKIIRCQNETNTLEKELNALKKESNQLKSQNKTLKKDNEDHVKRYKTLIEEKNTTFSENWSIKEEIKKIKDEKNQMEINYKIQLKQLQQQNKSIPTSPNIINNSTGVFRRSDSGIY